MQHVGSFLRTIEVADDGKVFGCNGNDIDYLALHPTQAFAHFTFTLECSQVSIGAHDQHMVMVTPTFEF